MVDADLCVLRPMRDQFALGSHRLGPERILNLDPCQLTHVGVLPGVWRPGVACILWFHKIGPSGLSMKSARLI